ncbi:MAG: cation:proton antiporter [Rhodothermales bacterium]
MTEEILVGIVSVIVLGIGAQWLAWRIRVPSILLLLIFGFVAGPVTGLLRPETLQGDWLFAFVSLSIGIILFEGGLSLRISELREVGKAVLNLITIGVLVTWALAGLAAYFVAGFNLGLSIQIGAILTVTGPTVVIPLLRHVRPTGRVGAIAKWEGITIDPAGAILAVLVLETILLLNQTPAAVGEVSGVTNAVLHAVEGLLLTIFISVGISVIGAAFLILILYRRLVPDYLQSSIALMTVVGTFALSNVLQEESGLLEVTLMGIIMANQKYVPVRRITEFKEDLQVLLIACLFILLSARLDLDVLDHFNSYAFAFLGVLIFVIRPIAVFVSSLGTRLTWKEKTFLSWLAPRGIVAAAVASLFAFRLEEIYGSAVDSVVPIVFLVIVGTVAVYGLTISPLARYLGLADPDPQGVLFLGAYLWTQRAAMALQKLGFKVLLIDSNTKNIQQAKENGLAAETADALSEAVIDELNLSGLGRFLALTANDEVNALAALHFTEVFENNEVYQLAARPGSQRDRHRELPEHLRGRPLFGESTTHASLSKRFNDGGEIRTFELTEDYPYEALQARYDEDVVLLFVVRGGGTLLVHAEENQLTPQPDDTVIVMLPSFLEERDLADEAFFEDLVAHAFVVDLDEEATYEEIVRHASILFAQRLPIAADRLARGFLESMRYGGAPISRGVALPHYRIPRISQPELVLVRCKPGICIEVEDDEEALFDPAEPIYAFLFLVSPEDNPGQHLRTLAHIAGRIGEEHFMEAWRSARDEQSMKEALMHPERYLSLVLSAQDKTATFIGQAVRELDLHSESLVALIKRNGQPIVVEGQTVLREGDQITITGNTADIQHLRNTYS